MSLRYKVKRWHLTLLRCTMHRHYRTMHNASPFPNSTVQLDLLSDKLGVVPRLMDNCVNYAVIDSVR